MIELMEGELSFADFINRIVEKSGELFDLVVKTNSGLGEYRYKKLRLVHHCCHVECNELNMAFKISVVAKGDSQGPFLFLWPADKVNSNQAACLGMPLINVFQT
jgi:hypothetical protein